MKPKKPPLHDFTSLSEQLPPRPATYRVFTKEGVFTAAYFDGKEFEVEVSHWANRKRVN